jgi:outer membrane immunogenic protein
MKSFTAVSALALLVSVSAASAADLSTTGGYKDGPVGNNSWTGFYLGVNGGYGRDSNVDFASTWAPTSAATVISNLKTGIAPEGWFGGAQAGYNFQQPGSSFVWGVETDIDASNISDSGTINGSVKVPAGSTSVALPGSGTYTVIHSNGTAGASGSYTAGNINPLVGGDTVNYTSGGAKSTIDYFGTVRARAGVLLGSSALAYGTGGLAYGGFSQRSTSSQWTASGDSTQLGWTVGGGLEAKLSDRWSVKGEYLFLDFPSVAIGTTGSKQDYEVNTFKVGVNYKLN